MMNQLNDFVTVHAAVIITRDTKVFLRKTDELPHLHLDGVVLNANEMENPRTKIRRLLQNKVGFAFSDEWLHYIGITVHKCDLDDDADYFAVIHYWLDITLFPECDIYFKDKGIVEMNLKDLAYSTELPTIVTDRNAARRVLHLQEKGIGTKVQII